LPQAKIAWQAWANRMRGVVYFLGPTTPELRSNNFRQGYSSATWTERKKSAFKR
jgi:hypothetical protein